MKNYSKQREEIIHVIKELYHHPTAEEIYFLAKQRDSAISRSTVYRNLNEFVKQGMITQISISNGPDRYDYKQDCQKHLHIVCTKCGQIYDFYDEMDEIKKAIFEQTRVEILDDGIVMKGICESCKKIEK